MNISCAARIYCITVVQNPQQRYREAIPHRSNKIFVITRHVQMHARRPRLAQPFAWLYTSSNRPPSLKSTRRCGHSSLSGRPPELSVSTSVLTPTCICAALLSGTLLRSVRRAGMAQRSRLAYLRHVPALCFSELVRAGDDVPAEGLQVAVEYLHAATYEQAARVQAVRVRDVSTSSLARNTEAPRTQRAKCWRSL